MQRAIHAIIVSMVLVTWVGQAEAQIVTTYYGDDDGFGIGATSGTLNPFSSNASFGEDPFTDIQLIGQIFSSGSFVPTGGFDPFVVGGTITGATLTMRAGSWVTGPLPLDGSNELYLDGLLVPSSFIASFTNTGDDIETRSVSLDSSFFASLADGSVSLNGSHFSENSGSGAFQIDFIQLDIQFSAVPEPSTFALLGIGAIGAVIAYRRRRKTITPAPPA